MKLLARASASRRGPGSRFATGTARAAALLGSLFVGSSAGAESARPGADASLAEIERCVTAQPGPPTSSGQFGATQPFAYRILCHSMTSSCSKF